MELEEIDRIALGGGCHWCTEAVFQSLTGVHLVEQGFVASFGSESNYSEAVIVHFDPIIISLEVLIEIHLHSHQSTSAHSLRKRYRSAIYTFKDTQFEIVHDILNQLKFSFNKPVITTVLPFKNFRSSPEKYRNYYFSDPEKPFCKKYINPKLKKLFLQFSTEMKNV